jgi:hypothetical protein
VNRPPNNALQRTRFALLRSPLSRKALGVVSGTSNPATVSYKK